MSLRTICTTCAHITDESSTYCCPTCDGSGSTYQRVNLWSYLAQRIQRVAA